MTNGFRSETELNWPAGHRGAVAIVVAVEGPVHSIPGSTADLGDDYAATGLLRLLELLEDFDVGVTTAWTESAVNTLPQLLRRVADQGHEIAAIFGANEIVSADSPLVGALKRVSGQAVSGALTSGGMSADSARIDTGFVWEITGTGGDLPVIVGGSSDQAASVHIPISPYWIDRTWLHPEHPQPPSSLLEAWSASLASIRADGSLMTVIVHPHILLRPGFSGTLTRFLDEIVASGDVWLTRLDHLATWWNQRSLGS